MGNSLAPLGLRIAEHRGIQAIPSETAERKSSAQGMDLGIMRFLEKNIEWIKQFVSVKQLAEIVFVPVHAFKAVKNCVTWRQKDKEEKIDAALEVATGIKEVGESSGAFVEALEELSAVSTSSVPWATPFTIVMSVFSLAGIVSNVRTCLKVRRLRKEIHAAEQAGKQDGKHTLASFLNVMNLIDARHEKNENFLKEKFNTKPNKFADAIVTIEYEVAKKLRSEDLQEQEEGRRMVEKTLGSLKKRLKRDITNAALSITASVVTLVGTVVLLASPLSLAAWAILAGSALIDISRLAHHKFVEYRFAQALNLKRTPLEWVLC